MLDQLGAYLNETRLSPSRALEELAEGSLALLGRRGNHTGEHPASVMQALLQDLEALWACPPHASTLLKAWTFLGAGPLPEAVLQIGGNWLLDTLHPGNSVRDVQSCLAFDFDRFSFRDYDRQRRTSTLHRLVSCLVQATMNAEERSIWAVRAIQVVAHTLEHPDPLYASSLQAQALRPLVQYCLRLIEQMGLTSPLVSHIRSSFLSKLREWG